MLILSRRIGESLKIGEQITIRVMAVRGFQVRIGIEAPEEIQVHRQEVYDKIQREKLKAEGG